MFPCSSPLFNDWPYNRSNGDNHMPYSDGMPIDHRSGGSRQGHRQPIKTSGEPRQHPGNVQPQGRSSRPVRSAPGSPRSRHHQQHPFLQQHQQQPHAHQQQPHAHQQQQQQQPQHQQLQQQATYGSGRSTAQTARKATKLLSPAAAATRIQAAWRGHRLAKHKAAVQQLGKCAEQLRQLAVQLREVQQQQPGIPLTQKQYLELSEPVMKVLFALDAVTCGAAVELRTKRKELSSRANKLLDELQAAHKAAPTAAAGTAAGAAASKSSSAATAAAAAPQQKQQEEAQGRTTRSKTMKGVLPWLRR